MGWVPAAPQTANELPPEFNRWKSVGQSRPPRLGSRRYQASWGDNFTWLGGVWLTQLPNLRIHKGFRADEWESGDSRWFLRVLRWYGDVCARGWRLRGVCAALVVDQRARSHFEAHSTHPRTRLNHKEPRAFEVPGPANWILPDKSVPRTRRKQEWRDELVGALRAGRQTRHPNRQQ